MSGMEADSLPAPSRKTWKSRLAMIAGLVAIVGSAVAVRSMWGPAPAGRRCRRQRRKQPVKAASAGKGRRRLEQKMKVMAVVNNQQILRDDLARECLLHHGKDVLESLMNKYLIAEHCKLRNIVITTKEVDAEIDRMADRFGMPTEQWLKLLKEERGIIERAIRQGHHLADAGAAQAGRCAVCRLRRRTCKWPTKHSSGRRCRCASSRPRTRRRRKPCGPR